MTGRHRAAAIVIALLGVATAACSGSDAGGPTASPSTVAGGSPSTSVQPSPIPSTTPPPTPEEDAAAAALAAVEGLWQVSQGSAQAPGARDWEPDFRKYADEAATAEALSNVQFALEGGTRQDGVYTIDPEVTGVDLAADPQPTASVTACFDSTGARTVDADTGEPTGLDPPPEFPRWELRVTVLQFPDRQGSPWLVHDFEPLTAQPC